MKKLLVITVATLLVAGAAFADGRLVAEPNATFIFGVTAGAAEGPTTTNNDDSCDISTAPAATLLLPYFNVEVNEPVTTARNTLFTVTNTSYLPQIAHVTVWTDWSFPVLDFNLFLTGYDVQAISIYDLLGGGGRAGFIGANAATSTSYGTVPPNNLVGNTGTTYADPRSAGTAPSSTSTNYNPNFLASASTDCAALPGILPADLVTDVRNLLTTGIGGNLSGCAVGGTQVQVGGSHANNAIGYITIDVAATCSVALPTNENYFLNEILFDNVLIGEYYDVNPDPATTGAGAGNYAGGNPMVHIRAIPEGGRPGSTPTGTTNLPYTFYDRYTPDANRRLDRRQPLPSTFAARWIAGTGALFDTRYKIWREGLTGSTLDSTCEDYGTNNARMPYVAMVRFDEAENAVVTTSTLPVVSPQPPGVAGALPETSQTPVSNTDVFPQFSGSLATATGGWMYMNLNNVGSTGVRATPPVAADVYSAARLGFEAGTTSTAQGEVRQSQNWVVVSMFAEGRYGVDFDAAWLGNGCSPSPNASTQIGPAGGVLVCPAGATCQTVITPAGTNVTP